ncbi:MAG TPA: translation initiation factor IF-2 subunit beta [Candidatus Diapherotrites archaeon]|uniref:Translation initiation factor IF-2 subunit beta n=1 Tax=Candidatus Iainarchaeum sp. TaxID=3101447 RepID=A0A7J4J4K9_9ARCH|nr:translation initiation factor IF-2 subunit beta [Candidatus Diapherotrites archaeon]
MMDYEKMLAKAYATMPKQALNKERFELPVLDSLVQGTKTQVKNFGQAVKTLGRDEKHALKFFTRELAVPITASDGKLQLNGKFSNVQLNEILNKYAKLFVLCHECQKPDTKIIEQHGTKVLKCDACGATSPVMRL